jgi:hypothetical protein
MIVATMTLTLPDGRVFPYRHEFDGPDDTETMAEFLYTDGNYACDCNLSESLYDAGHDVALMPCGNTIALTDLAITSVP